MSHRHRRRHVQRMGIDMAVPDRIVVDENDPTVPWCMSIHMSTHMSTRMATRMPIHGMPTRVSARHAYTRVCTACLHACLHGMPTRHAYTACLHLCLHGMATRMSIYLAVSAVGSDVCGHLAWRAWYAEVMRSALQSWSQTPLQHTVNILVFITNMSL